METESVDWSEEGDTVIGEDAVLFLHKEADSDGDDLIIDGGPALLLLFPGRR